MVDLLFYLLNIQYIQQLYSGTWCSKLLGLWYSDLACYCWLVWNVAKLDVQVVLEHSNIPLVTVISIQSAPENIHVTIGVIGII